MYTQRSTQAADSVLSGAFEVPRAPNPGDASLPVTIHAGHSLRGFIISMTPKGILAALPSGLSAGKIVEVEFEMPDGDSRLRVVGEVSWSNFYVSDDGVGFTGVGIEFFGIGDVGLGYLEDFVSANRGDRYWQHRELDVAV
jgi:hypothetical protein